MKFKKTHRSHSRVDRADCIPTWYEIQSCKDMNIQPEEYVDAKFYDGKHETTNKFEEVKEEIKMKIRRADEMLRDIETVADIVGFELDGNKNYTYACQLVTDADFEGRELTADEAEEFEDCTYAVRDQIMDFDFEAVQYLNY